MTLLASSTAADDPAVEPPVAPQRDRPLLHLCVAVAIIIVVASPLLFSDRTFEIDFTNSYWYVSVRDWQIDHSQIFNYYLQTYPTGLFYPFFAFYGGGMYTALGALSIVFDHHIQIVMDLYGLCLFGSAYGGTFWIGRQCGLRRTLAHIPAICVVTSAYWPTMIFGRGDWPEFTGVCAIPLLLASGYDLLQSEKLKTHVAIAFMVSTFFFVAAHAITLTWGATLIVVAGAVAIACYRERVRGFHWLRVIGLAVIPVLLDGWALVPLVLYSNSVVIAHNTNALQKAGSAFFDSFSNLFDPLRQVPRQSTTPGLFVQLPDWFLCWGVVVAAACAIFRKRFISRRFLAVVLVVFVPVMLLLLTSSTSSLPAPWKNIQYPYRLSSYVVYLTAALLIVSLLALEHVSGTARRVGFATLGVAVLMSSALCFWQLWIPDTQPNLQADGANALATRADSFTGINDPPATFAAFNDYADATQPKVAPTGGNHWWFPLSALTNNDEDLAEAVNFPPGILYDTNIAAGPEFVTVGGGMTRVGDDVNGRTVIARDVPGTGVITVTVSQVDSLPLRVAPIISIVGAVLFLGVIFAMIGRDLFRRRASPRHRRVDNVEGATADGLS